MTNKMDSIPALLRFNIDPQNAVVHHILVDKKGYAIEASYDGYEIQHLAEDMQREMGQEAHWYSIAVSANDDIDAVIGRNHNEFLKVDAEPFMDGNNSNVNPDALIKAIIDTPPQD